jgi:hypothetical protein
VLADALLASTLRIVDEVDDHHVAGWTDEPPRRWSPSAETSDVASRQCRRRALAHQRSRDRNGCGFTR